MWTLITCKTMKDCVASIERKTLIGGFLDWPAIYYVICFTPLEIGVLTARHYFLELCDSYPIPNASFIISIIKARN